MTYGRVAGSGARIHREESAGVLAGVRGPVSLVRNSNTRPSQSGGTDFYHMNALHVLVSLFPESIVPYFMGGREVLWRSLKSIGNTIAPSAMAPPNGKRVVHEGVFGTVGF